MPPSANFAYLAHHDPRLAALGTRAEEHFATDPAAALAALRVFGELLAQRTAAKVRLFEGMQEKQYALVDRLHDRGYINATQRGLFHDLRRAGNDAAHEWKGDHQTALLMLRVARELGVWFQRAFGNDRKFDPGPFVPPAPPAPAGGAAKVADLALQDELERLRKEREADKAALAAAAKAVEEAQQASARMTAAARQAAEEATRRAAEDMALLEAMVLEESQQKTRTAAGEAARSKALEVQLAALRQELLEVQAKAMAAPAAEIAATLQRSKEASDAIQLDEQATRMLIDGQLRAAGWEADSKTLTHQLGARPIRGRNLAISEWPTTTDGKGGRADYAPRPSATRPDLPRPTASSSPTARRGATTACPSSSRPMAGRISGSSSRRAASGSSTRGGPPTIPCRSRAGTPPTASAIS